MTSPTGKIMPYGSAVISTSKNVGEGFCPEHLDPHCTLHSRTTTTAAHPGRCRRRASTRHAVVPPPPLLGSSRRPCFCGLLAPRLSAARPTLGDRPHTAPTAAAGRSCAPRAFTHAQPPLAAFPQSTTAPCCIAVPALSRHRAVGPPSAAIACGRRLRSLPDPPGVSRQGRRVLHPTSARGWAGHRRLASVSASRSGPVAAIRRAALPWPLPPSPHGFSLQGAGFATPSRRCH